MSVPPTQRLASHEGKQRAEQRTRAVALVPRATGKDPVEALVQARGARSHEMRSETSVAGNMAHVDDLSPRTGYFEG